MNEVASLRAFYRNHFPGFGPRRQLKPMPAKTGMNLVLQEKGRPPLIFEAQDEVGESLVLL